VRELFAHNPHAALDPETPRNAMSIDVVADRILPSSAAPAETAPGAPARAASSAPSPFAQLVRALAHEADRGEATVRGVLSAGAAGNLGPSELLALQAGIYRYGETVDLAAKLIDKAGTDLRTVLSGQQ